MILWMLLMDTVVDAVAGTGVDIVLLLLLAFATRAIVLPKVAVAENAYCG